MNETILEEANLKIKVKSKFNYGGRTTPIDIRDSELILIERDTKKESSTYPRDSMKLVHFLEMERELHGLLKFSHHK